MRVPLGGATRKVSVVPIQVKSSPPTWVTPLIDTDRLASTAGSCVRVKAVCVPLPVKRSM